MYLWQDALFRYYFTILMTHDFNSSPQSALFNQFVSLL